MYYSLHDYVKILKAQKDRLIQTTITLSADKWQGIIEDYKLTNATTELLEKGIVVNEFQFVQTLPEIGEPNIGYVVGDICHMYNESWDMVYEFDSDAPYTQTVAISGVTPTNIVFAGADTDMYNLEIVSRCKMLATGQDVDLITFTAFDDRPARSVEEGQDKDVVFHLVIGSEGRRDGGRIV